MDDEREKLETNLREAVAALANHKGTRSATEVRRVCEDELENNIASTDETAAMIEQYAHTFYGLKEESPVDRNYLRLYMLNLVEAARGKQ